MRSAAAAVCCSLCHTQGWLHIAVPFHPLLQRSTILHHPLPAGNRVEVKKVDAYQYTLTPDSGLQCNQTLYATWKNDTGFDVDAFAGRAWSAFGNRTGREQNRTTDACQLRWISETEACLSSLPLQE